MKCLRTSPREVRFIQLLLIHNKNIKGGFLSAKGEITMKNEILSLGMDSNIDSIKNLLKLGLYKNKLIYTNNIRGIGKTTALIQFAKENDFGVIVKNTNRCINDLKRQFNYNFIYNENNISCMRSSKIQNFVIDESVNNILDLQRFINIVTGLTLVEKNAEVLLHIENKYYDVISDKCAIVILNANIKQLLVKIQTTQESDKMGDYKMLINNLIKTIEARHLLEENNVSE